ncbi:MAG TPA: hypothetical protein VL443_01625 [Cyclobacteriaceae bacterium]|jgi:hypothetical protein|nr:hypothetical protein [Cyclobacteriaceae bacterium]
METIILGSKEIFAIQYKHGQNQKLGYVRFWLNNIYLGAEHDEVYFSYMQGEFRHILNNKHKLFESFPYADYDSAEDILDEVLKSKLELSGANLIDKYILGFGESFDDFFIVGFFSNNKINFVWKLEEKPHFEYPNYPTEALMASVDIVYFERIIKEFDKSLLDTSQQLL